MLSLNAQENVLKGRVYRLKRVPRKMLQLRSECRFIGDNLLKKRESMQMLKLRIGNTVSTVWGST
jgi:hypothetical protein